MTVQIHSVSIWKGSRIIHGAAATRIKQAKKEMRQRQREEGGEERQWQKEANDFADFFNALWGGDLLMESAFPLE